jgi:hypothetical protein
VASAGCFYTGPINRRPFARITELDADPHYVGQSIRLIAAKSEDDDRVLVARWRAFACIGGGACARLGDDTVIEDLDDPFVVTVPTQDAVDLPRFDRIEVELSVEDPHGAVGTDSLALVVQNRDPMLRMQDTGFTDPRPGGGYVLGLPIRLAAEVVDSDMDAVELSWKTPRPPVGGGSDPNSVVFEPDGSDDRRRFVPDVPGLWEIEAVADDGAGGVVSVVRPILVEADHPPCIDLVDPPAVADDMYVVDREGAPRRFSVLSVADALDVFPLPADALPEVAEAVFSWKIATPDTGGELVPLSGYAEPDYVIDPSAYASGDVVRLQVDVSDRVVRTPCADADPTCSMEGDDCYQRLSWGIEIR